MEFEKIKAWLDEIVDIVRRERDVECFSNNISLCNAYKYYTQFYQGIDIVADVMGLDLYESQRDDEKYRYEYSFTYKGVYFTQIEEERLERYVRG